MAALSAQEHLEPQVRDTVFLLADSLIYLLNGAGRPTAFQAFRLALPLLLPPP